MNISHRLRFQVFLLLGFCIVFSSAVWSQHIEPPCTVLQLHLPPYVVAGTTATLAVDVNGAKKVLGEKGASSLSYKWELSNGEIVSGQGTNKIMIDTKASDTRGIKDVSITIEVGGLPPTCQNKLTQSLRFDPACSPPEKLDELLELSVSEEQHRLDTVATYFAKSKTDSVLYLVAYAGRTPCRWEAEWRANRAKRYLIESCKLPSERILVIDGGFRDESLMEVFISPSGACGPLPKPTLASDDVRISGLCTDK